MTHYLAIDTTGKALSYSLGSSVDEAFGAEISLTEERVVDEPNSHDEKLAGGVRALLGDHGLSPRDIRAILLSNGPGAFTGLRIGLSFAKGFAFATGASLLLFDTLRAKKHSLAAKDPALLEKAVILRHSHAGNFYVHTGDETRYCPSETLHGTLTGILNESREESSEKSGQEMPLYSDRAEGLECLERLGKIKPVTFRSSDIIAAYNNGCSYETHPSGEAAVPYYKQNFVPTKARKEA